MTERYISATGGPPRASRACVRRVARAGARLALGGGVLLAACRASTSGEDEAAQPRGGSEPSRFSFVLPADFVPVSLRGEGSETLRAPAGARAHAIDGGVRVEAGPDFEVEVRSPSPLLAEVVARTEPAARVYEDRETLVFQVGAGHAFVVVRELIPEWDDSERRRVACSSAGVSLGEDVTPGAAVRFSRAAVERMVAACRTLELPKLE